MMTVATRKDTTNIAARKAMESDGCFLLREVLADRFPLEDVSFRVDDFEAAVRL